MKFEQNLACQDLRHVVLDVRPVPPQPLTLSLGVCQSHPQERKLGELRHHSLNEILWKKQHLDSFGLHVTAISGSVSAQTIKLRHELYMIVKVISMSRSKIFKLNILNDMNFKSPVKFMCHLLQYFMRTIYTVFSLDPLYSLCSWP